MRESPLALKESTMEIALITYICFWLTLAAGASA